MKIETLSIQNFSSHPLTTINFGAPITMVVGALNAGKSSLLQSIEWALTGECGFYRKKTDGKSDLITSGQRQMSVGLATDMITIRRALNTDNITAVESNGRVLANPAALDSAINGRFGMSKETISAILNTTDFFGMEQTKQKELIIALTGAEITPQKIKEHFAGEVDALKILHGHTMDSLSALDNAFKYVFARRTDVKRDLGALIPPPAPEGTAPPIDSINAMLAGLQKELEQKIAEKSHLEGAASVVSVRQTLEVSRDRLKAQLEQAAPDVAAAGHRLDKTLETQRGIEKELDEIKNRLIDAKANLRARELNLKLLQDFKGICVAGDHPCPASLPDMQKAKQQQADAMSQAIDAQADLTDLVAKKNRDLAFAEEVVNKARRDLDSMTSAAQNRARVEQELKDVEIGLSKADGPQVDRTKIEALNAAIEQLRGRLNTGRQKIQEAQSWVDRQKQVAAVATRRRDLEIEVRRLESLCEYLGPKGIKVKLIDERIKTFIDEININMKMFGFEMTLTVDPWRITAKGQPLGRLSRSERFRLGIAFQVAIAKMSGLHMVVIDDSELLTPPVRVQMIEMLLAAGLSQAIVILTIMVPLSEFKHPQHPKIEWLAIQNVDGKSTVSKI